MYSWTSPGIPVVPASSGNLVDHLVIFDTAAGQLVPSRPRNGQARMYVCGITPYDATHLGHANTYVTFDLLNRVWRDLGHEVNYTQNVTDIDDPLLERAQETGQDWEELASDQIELFRTDMEALRVIAPRHFVGAVECIPGVVDLVERLKGTGLIYQVEDEQYRDWYFNTVAAPGYGRVAALGEDEAARIFAERGGDPERPGKKHPLDCLIWRQERPGEPAWQSVLGPGRPGWHIECAAISLRHLGPTFDIQGGGSDLIFPHHEMCAAEVFAASGQPMASAYVHSGMVGLDGEKMSKSKGNLELVSRLRQKGADPMAIRLALLDHHYRADWEWTVADLERANQRLETWRRLKDRPAKDAATTIAALRQAMRTDLDAPMALKIIDRWTENNLADGTGEIAESQAVFTVVDALLGVLI